MQKQVLLLFLSLSLVDKRFNECCVYTPPTFDFLNGLPVIVWDEHFTNTNTTKSIQWVSLAICGRCLRRVAPSPFEGQVVKMAMSRGILCWFYAVATSDSQTMKEEHKMYVLSPCSNCIQGSIKMMFLKLC